MGSVTVPGCTLGIDFGTSNSVAALSSGSQNSSLINLNGPDGEGAIFRSALCFWQDDAVRGGLAHEAGPWAIAEYLDFPQGSRFLQSFKSVVASSSFEHATIFGKRLRFEELGHIFLDHDLPPPSGPVVVLVDYVHRRHCRVEV